MAIIEYTHPRTRFTNPSKVKMYPKYCFLTIAYCFCSTIPYCQEIMYMIHLNLRSFHESAVRILRCLIKLLCDFFFVQPGVEKKTKSKQGKTKPSKKPSKTKQSSNKKPVCGNTLFSECSGKLSLVSLYCSVKQMRQA